MIAGNKLFRNINYNKDALLAEAIETKERELQRKAKKVPTHWIKYLKGALR